jgi:hypothetical protein
MPPPAIRARHSNLVRDFQFPHTCHRHSQARRAEHERRLRNATCMSETPWESTSSTKRRRRTPTIFKSWVDTVCHDPNRPGIRGISSRGARARSGGLPVSAE